MEEQKIDPLVNSPAGQAGQTEVKNDEADGSVTANAGQAGSLAPGRAGGQAPQSELEKAQQERDEYLNGWKRAKADLINYQKDESKRLRDAMSYGSEMVMRDLVLVLDSFELASMAGKEDEGTKAIRNQLADVLKRHGLEKMKLSPGDAFDPNLHESLGEIENVPSAGSAGSPRESSGQVAVEIESGYLLNGKVVRPARVKLSK